jgi:hypothetical protein
MSTRAKSDVADLIRRLSDSKVINTDVTLKATLGVVSGGGSADEFEPLDFWCGTIRRPWVIVRPHFDIDQTIVELTRSLTDLRQQANRQVGARQANQ